MKEESIRIGSKRHLLLGKAYKATICRFLANIEKLGLDINFDQWMILGPIWQLNGASHKELGEISTKDKTTVTRTIDSLENKNLVVRVSDQIDKRIKRVVLTNKGKKLFYDILPIMDKTRMEMRKNISEEDLKVFENVLKQLITNNENLSNS
jgi:DNA-binding MarR family transcriptional regulator